MTFLAKVISHVQVEQKLSFVLLKEGVIVGLADLVGLELLLPSMQVK